MATTTTTVGRIWLENADGKVMATADYTCPAILRERSIAIGDGVFVQNRQRHDGIWVYRYSHRAPQDDTDRDIRDIRTLESVNWDGPMPKSPDPTLDDARALVAVCLAEMSGTDRELHGRDLRQLHTLLSLIP